MILRDCALRVQFAINSSRRLFLVRRYAIQIWICFVFFVSQIIPPQDALNCEAICWTYKMNGGIYCETRASPQIWFFKSAHCACLIKKFLSDKMTKMSNYAFISFKSLLFGNIIENWKWTCPVLSTCTMHKSSTAQIQDGDCFTELWSHYEANVTSESCATHRILFWFRLLMKHWTLQSVTACC